MQRYDFFIAVYELFPIYFRTSVYKLLLRRAVLQFSRGYSHTLKILLYLYINIELIFNFHRTYFGTATLQCRNKPAWVNIAGSNFRLGSYKDLNGLKFQLVEYRDLKGEPVGGVVREPVARVVAAADLVPIPRFFSSSMAASVIELLLGLLRIALSVAPRSVVSS